MLTLNPREWTWWKEKLQYRKIKNYIRIGFFMLRKNCLQKKKERKRYKSQVNKKYWIKLTNWIFDYWLYLQKIFYLRDISFYYFLEAEWITKSFYIREFKLVYRLSGLLDIRLRIMWLFVKHTAVTEIIDESWAD